MTVGELIDMLKKFDRSLEVVPVEYYGEGSREELCDPELNDDGQVEI
ncbi:hypothetical protein PQR71_41785 [Paraburkholderia fungorum]